MRTILLALAAAATASTVLAEEENFALSPTYVEECGSCHIAFPPALLSADSWKAVIAGLDRHFDDDASLDPATTRQIEDWLVANAAWETTPDARGRPAIRISDTRWFRREHRDGEEGLSAAVWRSPAVGSPANCSACHRDADTGAYDEASLQVPRNALGGRQ